MPPQLPTYIPDATVKDDLSAEQAADAVLTDASGLSSGDLRSSTVDVDTAGLIGPAIPLDDGPGSADSTAAAPDLAEPEDVAGIASEEEIEQVMLAELDSLSG